MDPQVISWIVSLIAGGAGGNIVGALLKDRNLGPLLNTVLGVAGGGIGGKLLPMLVPAIGALVAIPAAFVVAKRILAVTAKQA
jgi:uncharacterized membrane protein YeaQ/YmgE (transglycosylase-associated protein family)